MLDIGWSEFFLIALVALLVVGPRDLPGVLRAAGRWIRKIRGMAYDFQSSLEEMTRDTDLDEAREQFRSIRNFDLKSEAEKAFDPDGSFREEFDPNLDAVMEDHAAKSKAQVAPATPSLEKPAKAPAEAAEVPDAASPTPDTAPEASAKTAEPEPSKPGIAGGAAP